MMLTGLQGPYRRQLYSLRRPSARETRVTGICPWAGVGGAEGRVRKSSPVEPKLTKVGVQCDTGGRTAT